MASGLCSCWTSLWTVALFTSVFSDSTYTISDYQVPFDLALQNCVGGFLTTFATKQEINKILSLISGSGSPQGNFTFWVGLKKEKKDCVDYLLPLRGFRWTETHSEASEEAHWAEEPESTCTSTLCAAVRVNLDGSQLIRWGLMSARCKSTHRFICKLKDILTGQTPTHRETSTVLATSEPKSATSEPNPKASETPHGPKLFTRLEEVLKPTTVTKQVGRDQGLSSGPALGSNSCKWPIIPGSRSLRPNPEHNSIRVECWPNDVLEVYCQPHPAIWLLPDHSPANFSTICQRCGIGFQKDASANCVDIDECSSDRAHCKHTCVNTEGSYKCVCADGRHQQEDCADSVAVEDSGPLSRILIPVLVAVVTLVVLVVVVVVTVKCCLMRKSKKKVEKMAMKNKDNERT